MSLDPNVLLLGSLYALEQCGLLLTDATALLEQRRYPTAAGIALLAREELGRHQILLDLWRQSVAGRPVTPGEVEKACDDHVEKQRRAQLSLTLRAQSGDQLDELHRTKFSSEPGSEEWRTADLKLQAIVERRRKRQPTDRHETRMSAFYVDLADDQSWSRPIDLDPRVCANEFVDAMNDYTNARDRIEQAAELHDDHQLAGAIVGLTNPPMFPPIRWPPVEVMLPPSKKSS